ncbi:MAG TPA: 4'-phosphopantetheinyl transferase superfamily protein [Candidatus Polarisedimenticolia bacterium]|nr:4'-phosphopantetheinyl transferase superfamily protein [Candidatus Polarisedimenticolia bacterium]
MLETLLPAEVRIRKLSEEVDPALLYPEEAACIAAAVPARRREFAQGRLCARRALADLEIRHFPLLAGKDRAPIWPPGVVGSLTHCGGICAAAVARADRIAGVGIDIESAEPLGDDLLRLVCVPAERARLDASPESSRGLRAKLLFSAKESVFKCFHPLTGVFLDFLDCEITIDDDAGDFIAVLSHPQLPETLRGTDLRGRFARDSRHLFTGIACPRP